jgi:hypothetical protein
VDAAEVREWIVALCASVTLLAVALSVWLGVREYHRKLQAEEGLAQIARAEADVRLVQAFTDLVLLAGGSGRYALSNEILRTLLDSGAIGEEDFDPDDPVGLHTKVARLAMMPATGGGPTAHRYALFGVAALAARHPLLRDLGIKALELERVRETAPEKVQELLRDLRGQA